MRGWCVRRGEEDTLCRILLTQGLELLMCRKTGAIFQTQGRVSKTCLLVVREKIEMEEDLLGSHTRSKTTVIEHYPRGEKRVPAWVANFRGRPALRSHTDLQSHPIPLNGHTKRE